MTPDETTRKTLLERLRYMEDGKSWREFFDRYWNLLYGFAVRRGLSHEEAEEAVQDTVIVVAGKIGDFQYDPSKGTFKGWLFQITRRKVVDRFRTRPKVREVGFLENDSAGDQAPDRDDFKDTWEEEWTTHIKKQAEEETLRRVKPAQFQVYDCYVRKEWSVKKVCKTLGITPNQVYLAKNRVGAVLQQEAEKLAEGSL